MAYGIVHFFPGGTQSQYDATLAAVHPRRRVARRTDISRCGGVRRRLDDCGDPRLDDLHFAASIGWRHATADPVRALLLAWRVLPAPLRAVLRVTGPYGRATVLWGAGERDAALAALAASPRRLAAFALAVDQPAAAAAALARLPEDDRARPVLAARLAWREGRLTEALSALDGARGRPARRLRRTLAAEQADPAIP